MNSRCLRPLLLMCLVLVFGVSVTFVPRAAAQPAKTQPAQKKQRDGKAARPPKRAAPASAEKRAAALRAIAKSLDVGAGATIADIGAGKGRDSTVFASIVGESGTVFSEEISEGDVRAIRQMAKQRSLPQIKAVLGKTASPGLPESTVDMAYMHYVYHHFTQPQAMLQGLWKAIKPGGYLVIVDRHRGTLRDWVPREERGPKHFWIAETTVVREAREEGFEFARCAEDLWPADDQFVLVFRRPRNATGPGSDPDSKRPLDLAKLKHALLPTADVRFNHPVLIALGPARQLIGPIMQHTSGTGVDVILEEWATRKDEHPALPDGLSMPSTLTDNGDPKLGDQPVDAVFFLDTYALLFHHENLLAKIHEHLTPQGKVFIMDRKTDLPQTRRLASHRRMISVDVVKKEMQQAGFELLRTEPAPAPDRFLLVFGKKK